MPGKRLPLLFLLFPFFLSAQHNVSGIVLDKNKERLIGATIAVQGELMGTITNKEGAFSLKNIQPGKYILVCAYLGYEEKKVEIEVPTNEDLKIVLSQNSIFTLDDINVKATWANDKTPFAYHNVDKSTLAKVNLGQDLPFLLRNTPSLVVTSDAGAGVGYTGLRIRGSDASRINITVNGIPINDSESQGVFWVNMPDFASSTESIQIQRGVGTSTNGAGAFGATVNLETNSLRTKPYAEIGNSFGTFNTRRHNLKVGSGLMQNKIAVDARLSLIQSDGYIDRATANLRSGYFSAGYYGDKTIVKAVTFTGREKTYQSWNGTPEAILEGTPEALNAFADRNFLSESQRQNLLNSGRTYNFYEYENEVDNYGQDHYQLHWSQYLSKAFSLNAALHYTRGQGYFEQFREDDDFADYSLPALVIGDSTIANGDFIRRRWLDNDFFGYTSNLNFNTDNFRLTFGSSFNKYIGDHFGEIIWAEFGSNIDIRDRYYENRGEKTDLNLFLKSEFSIGESWNIFADLQYRKVDYEVNGIDADLRPLEVLEAYNFFNPKVGISKNIGANQNIFLSAAVANREPNRGDLIDALADTEVKPEQLLDIELGYKANWKKAGIELNLYQMMYKDQLVLTGAVNDVGTPIRINVPESYRQGIEFQFGWRPNEKFGWNINSTFSANKIKSFTEVVYDYTVDFEIIENKFDLTDISFSPSIILGSEIIYRPIRSLELGWMAKYVGSQFLDNTSNPDRAIDAYFVNDLRLGWTPTFGNYQGLAFNFMLNNVLNEQFSSNGYTYSYIVGDLVTENFFYPQAGIHFLAGLTLKF